ncbi:MAG TPA: hypothetical protein VM261_03565 [Kofleriaceae bacterium]|nr:hypothetical protein [Kofleriaceae bacterium]
MSAADQLNLVQTEVRRVALAAASSSRYAPRPYRETRAFRTLVARALRRSQFPLDELAKLKYVTRDEATALRRLNVRVVGDIFAASKGATPAPRHAVRERLLDASIKLFSSET